MSSAFKQNKLIVLLLSALLVWNGTQCTKITVTETEPSEENLSSDLSLGTGLNFKVKIVKKDPKNEEVTDELSVEDVEFMVSFLSAYNGGAN